MREPERDLLAGQAVRVAAAVPALVGGADDLRHRAHRRRRFRMRSPSSVCWRMNAHSLVVERARACRGSRRAPRPCRRRAARRRGRPRRVPRPRLRAAARRRRPARRRRSTCAASVGLAGVQRAHQHVARLRGRRRRAAVLARVHALVGESAGPATGVSASCGTTRRAVGALDVEPLAGVAQRRRRRREHARARVGVDRQQRAELVAAEAVGLAERPRRRRSLGPRRASSASPARWPKLSL